MLEAFSSKSVAVGEILCASSLDERHFVNFESMHAVMNQFEMNPQFNDMVKEAQPLLLSVNNSLITRKMNSKFHKFNYCDEANPLEFYSGYEATNDWLDNLSLFMQDFFEIGKQEADTILDDLDSMYNAQFDPDSDLDGHLIQIFVPSNVLHEFVYLAMDYGRPVTVYRSKTADSYGYSKCECYSRKPEGERESLEPMDIAHVLKSRWGAHLQSRIIGHPNLFLKHGAHAHIYHGDPGFDSQRFHREMLDRLNPYILKAMAMGKTLRYNLFGT